VFLGRHVVEAALARGHDVTLFHRGRRGAELFAGKVERILGDRTVADDLARLCAVCGGRTWDAVVDTCGYVPRVVGMSAEMLASACAHYTFVSSLSVYAESAEPGADESAPVARLDDETQEAITGETYGPLKALCEEAAERAMPGRVLRVRSGLIVGPHDPSDRFTYWPVRAARGGAMLVPAPADWPVEGTDVRDLATWIVSCAERRVAGTFNTTQPWTIARLLDACVRGGRAEGAAEGAGDGPPELVWADLDWLTAQGVAPWTDLPLRATERGFGTRSAARARDAGLRFRPLADTVRDTLEWARAREGGLARPLAAGLDPERERELVRAWRTRAATGE
jgi:2'-hydroxyisoflavone reductase